MVATLTTLCVLTAETESEQSRVAVGGQVQMSGYKVVPLTPGIVLVLLEYSKEHLFSESVPDLRNVRCSI